jgi:hypothetical protein
VCAFVGLFVIGITFLNINNAAMSNNQPSVSSPVPRSNPITSSSSSSPPSDPDEQIRVMSEYIARLEAQMSATSVTSRHESVVGPRQVTPYPTTSSATDASNNRSSNSVDDASESYSNYDPFRRPPPLTARTSQIRVNAPTKFDGKDDDVSKLENFITAMERYLRLHEVSTNSVQSFHVGALSLSDTASAWLRHVETRDPDAITSWNELKKRLRARFAPVAQQQLAFRRLEAVVHRKGVSQLNHDFMEQLQLMPAYNKPEFDPIMIDMYLSALERGANTRFILTTLRVKISEDPGLTLDKVMQIALLAEANQGRAYNVKSTSFMTAAIPSRPSSTSSSSSVPSRSFSSSSWRSNGGGYQNRFGGRFNRSPIKPPSFTSPQVKLHHIDTDSFDENPEDGYNDAADAFEREMDGSSGSDNDDGNRVPQFHQDIGAAADDDGVRINASDPFAGLSSDVALNMIRFAKRFSDVHNLSADELDRRRRNNLCFNCGGTDHRARDCKKPKPSSTNGSGNNHKSQPSKKHF